MARKKKGFNFTLRVSRELVDELDALRDRFNSDIGLEMFGHVYTRADVLRAVIKKGIEETNRVLPPVTPPESPPETPTSTPKS